MLKNFFTLVLFLLLFSVAVYGQSDFSDTISDMLDSVSVDRIETTIRDLESAGGHYSRVTYTPGNEVAVHYILDRFQKIPGLSRVYVDTFYVSSAPEPYDTMPLYNVVAELDGSQGRDSYYLFGAHYDCSASRESDTDWETSWSTMKAPGADDNATGVAAILEMARILSDSSFGFEPVHSIRFVAFGSEERNPGHGTSHVGSVHTASEADASGDLLRGMVSIDMIGYNPKKFYNSIVTNNSSKLFAEYFVNLEEQFDAGVELEIFNEPNSTYSDHEAFWRYGYQAILFIENAPPWTTTPNYDRNYFYHTSGDSAGTVNMELVSRVTKVNLAAAAAFSGLLTGVEENTPELPGSFALEQNYPNPFNPSTTINYTLNEPGFTEIGIFNSLGQKVSAPVAEYKDAGRYTLTWNASGYSSGVYFCRLSSGSKAKTIRMLLLK